MSDSDRKPSELVIVTWKGCRHSDDNLAKLARWLGLAVKIVELSSESPDLTARTDLYSTTPLALAMNSNTMARFVEGTRDQETLKNFLYSKVRCLFCYGFTPSSSAGHVIESISDGRLTGVGGLTGNTLRYRVNSQYRQFGRQLSGLEFGPVSTETDSAFHASGVDDNSRSLISIGDNPFLVELRRYQSSFYLAAVSGILDIDKPAPPGFSLRQSFSQVLPAMMFLRHVFGDQCWHSPRSFASFVIDDPLLRKRYGFLDYQELLEAMDSHNFSATIAFIPWNFRRSDPAIADLFRQRPDRLSLGVHGCDHTGGEFGSLDSTVLRRLAKTARARMQVHRELNGVDYDACFVFPQGVFSKAAMKALQSANYLAAVNSTLYAIDDPGQLRVHDLMDATVMKYSSFPLFRRRYPGEIADFALDLFLGKPAIIAEHHDYFRHGYESLIELVERLRQVEPDLIWTNLGEVVESTYLQRVNGGVVEVRFFADRLSVTNDSGSPLNCLFLKQESSPDRIRQVALNSHSIPYNITGDLLAFNAVIEAGAQQIRILSAEPSPKIMAGTLLHRLRVQVRRRLSEARDNYLSKSEHILRLVESIAGRLRSHSTERASRGE